MHSLNLIKTHQTVTRSDQLFLSTDNYQLISKMTKKIYLDHLMDSHFAWYIFGWYKGKF